MLGGGKGEVKPPKCPTRHPRVGGYIYIYVHVYVLCIICVYIYMYLWILWMTIINAMAHIPKIAEGFQQCLVKATVQALGSCGGYHNGPT